ncbi:MAG: hypothetical protein HOB82_10560 [Alphaproteobacteria bacterium]|jgi:hypothetical protein|nr:hypothetical protein [Alphaproteobacteria bacterium]MBT5859726.1 hypothetical protein [Alphaproteobacteria bacterium]
MHSDGFLAEREQFDVFTDLLFNALLGFVFMFLIAFMLINPISDTGKVDPKAEVLITVTWPDQHPDDIDLYVEDPNGGVVWYHVKEAGLMHLDRDDRGNYRDTITVDGQKINNPLNQETVTIRGIIPGEFVINVHHYLANGTEDVPVEVKVEKLNPEVTLVFYTTLQMDHKGQELTAARFTMDDEGQISDVNRRPKTLVRSRKGA